MKIKPLKRLSWRHRYTHAYCKLSNLLIESMSVAWYVQYESGIEFEIFLRSSVNIVKKIKRLL